MLSSFLTPFMASSINVALDPIAAEFSMNAVLLTWVATSYLLAAAVFLVPFGRLADICGRKRIFVYGMWLFTAASVLCALAPSSELLIAFRAFQGFASAMIFGTSVAILTSVYPLAERGRVLGLSVAIVYLGLSLGPSVGGVLTEFLGWRSLFVVMLPISAAIVWVANTRLKGEWAGCSGEPFDYAGAAIYAVSLTGVIIGLSVQPSVSGAVLIGLGSAGIVAFVLLELRLKYPVLEMKLFRESRAFTFSNIAALINYSATFAVTFMMALYLRFVKGFSIDFLGIVLVSQPIVMAVFSPLAGRLSDIVEPQRISSVGMAISAVGLVILSFMDAGTELWAIIATLAFLGFGFALFSSPNTNAIMSSVERKHFGIASASVGTMRLIGQVLSLGIATLFIALFVGEQDLTPTLAPEFLKSFQLAFETFAVLCFIGVGASLARGKVRREVPHHP